MRMLTDTCTLAGNGLTFKVYTSPKTFRSSPGDRIFNAKSLTLYRALQQICKAHETPAQSQLANDLQLPTHG
ncbi:MAG: hypothetical protein ABIN67_16165 [Ferruginibacter sp.]